MLRAFLSAVVISAATLAAAGVQAQTNGYYVATPAAKPIKARLMTRSTQWSLQGDSFVAARAPEREAVLCQLVAHDVGALSSFTVAGKAFDATALDKCNAKAGGAPGSMANN